MIIQRFVLVLAIVLSNSAMASDHQTDHHKHEKALAFAAGIATQPGQGAFAAIAEIVEILNNDPETDWSRVQIDALRQHLVDMNMLTLNTDIETVMLPDAIVFRATGSGRTLDAIRRMIPAHAVELNKLADWTATTTSMPRGITLTMSTARANELSRIKALGFFGVMATGAHHQKHHLSIANGMSQRH